MPANELAASFAYQDSGTADAATVTATLNGEATTPVTVADRRLVLNEIDYDTPGTDSDEFVELYNGTSAAIDLSSYVLVGVNGNNNDDYAQQPLSGILPSGGYLVIRQNPAMPIGADALALTLAFSLQNGSPDGVALMRIVGGTTAEVVDVLSYEGEITAVSIDLAGTPPPVTVSLVEGPALPRSVEDAGAGGLIRYPNGFDTDRAAEDWRYTGTLTPGTANAP